MKYLDEPLFRRLVEVSDTTCVSIYLSGGGQHAGRNEDARKRFADLVDRAEAEVERHGSTPADADLLLKPARLYLEEAPLWRRHELGLAFFLERNGFCRLSLPWPCGDHLVVGSSFHLAPLLRYVDGGRNFFILALGSLSTRLFQASEQALLALPLEVAGASSEPEEMRSTPPHDARPPRAFLERLDLEVRRRLRWQGAPLVVLGEASRVEAFAALSAVRELLPVPDMDADGLSRDQLHAHAWRVAEAKLEARREQSARFLDRPRGDRILSRDVDRILSAARQGRVETLYLADEVLTSFERPAQGSGGWHEKSGLLTRAAFESWRHGGLICAVEGRKIPGRAPAAALLRA